MAAALARGVRHVDTAAEYGTEAVAQGGRLGWWGVAWEACGRRGWSAGRSL